LFTEREKRIYSLKPVHLDSGDQGDQLGEIFAYWSIVSTLKKYETDKDFSYVHISTVTVTWVLTYFDKKTRMGNILAIFSQSLYGYTAVD
jgi:hypothetical protein